MSRQIVGWGTAVLGLVAVVGFGAGVVGNHASATELPSVISVKVPITRENHCAGLPRDPGASFLPKRPPSTTPSAPKNNRSSICERVTGVSKRAARRVASHQKTANAARYVRPYQ